MTPLTNLLKTSELRGHQIIADVSEICDILDGMQKEINDSHNLVQFLYNMLIISLLTEHKENKDNK